MGDRVKIAYEQMTDLMERIPADCETSYEHVLRRILELAKADPFLAVSTIHRWLENELPAYVAHREYR